MPGSRPISVINRLREQNPLPEGAISVAVGLGISGVANVAFLGIAARRLGPADLSAFGVLWTAMFAIGNGVMQPLEQEVSRAVSDRRSRGVGAAPVVRRAATIGACFTLVFTVATIIGFGPLTDHWFNGNTGLTFALIVGLFGFCVAHLTRGVLSSHGRFRAYARFFTVDGLSRVGLIGALALLGVTAVGPYGLVLAFTAFIGVASALAGERSLMEDGPEADWSEITVKLGWLLLGTAMLALVVQAGTIAVQMLASPEQEGAAGQFMKGLTAARIPLFLFQAVLASLLPKLSRLAGQGRLPEFISTLRRLVVVILGAGVLIVLCAALIGPFVVGLAFNGTTLTARDLALLAAAFILIMATICIDQALIALNAHSRMAIGWLLAFATFVVVTAMGSDLFLRVELGLVAAGLVGFAWMATMLAGRLREHPTIVDISEGEALAEIPTP